MIHKILIANRGEIAVRIMRTCKQLSIATVAVYSDADANAYHVLQSDEAVHVGASPASESYLVGEKIIAAAWRTHADAIHPGYGFLSENASFAQAVIDAGLIWIGPKPETIDLMGDKRRAKLALRDVPLVPGYNGEAQDDETLTHEAETIGFPIMVKAAAGGGGKGMRLVPNMDEFLPALAAARREAKAAFGDDTLILERAIVDPRHIEVQIFGDTHGNVIHLYERECSIQRRHQKIIEEAPSPAVDAALRERICNTAVSIGQQVGYVNAGTVEFIMDAARNFYFLEMNTRIQVEHPVTEAITRLDLVEWQIRVASGEPLPLLQAPPMRGHAIEARIYAEDPSNEFLPTTGKVVHWDSVTNRHIRIDQGVIDGDSVDVFYDPLLAKVVANNETREETIRDLENVLKKHPVLGLRTNISFLRRILHERDFVVGEIDTGYIGRHPALVTESIETPPHALIAVAVAKTAAMINTSKTEQIGWRNNPYRPMRHTFRIGEQSTDVHVSVSNSQEYRVTLNGIDHTVSAEPSKHTIMHHWTITVDGHRQNAVIASETTDDGETWWVGTQEGTYALEWISPLPAGKRAEAESAGSLRSPMPGQVIRVDVVEGQTVAKGEVLMILEAMKMEHRIKAPYDGLVKALYYQSGQSVAAGVKLLELEASDSPSALSPSL